MRNVNTLVAVAGHAVYADGVRRVPENPADERHWVLQGFQTGEVPIYLTHMRQGADLVAADPSSIGLMSGGRTRQAGGRWSEAQTYLDTATHYRFWQADDAATAEVQGRFDADPYARDSLENMWHSLLFYHRKLGRMPLHLAMIGWQIKEPRFRHHAETLGIPEDVFSYVGVPLGAYGNTVRPQDEKGFIKGEGIALEQWQATPLGDSGPLLVKRTDRDPFAVPIPYSWAEYVEAARRANWHPSQEVLAASALEGAAAA